VRPRGPVPVRRLAPLRLSWNNQVRVAVQVVARSLFPIRSAAAYLAASRAESAKTNCWGLRA
jgi:hypothetical protein